MKKNTKRLSEKIMEEAEVIENETMYNGKLVKTIDCTPTWRGILTLLLELHASKNQEASEKARIELFRMAEIADKYVELSKSKSKSR